MKKLLTLVIIILTGLILSSCWDFKQIDNYYILTGLAIDRGDDNELIVTTRIPVPITGLQTSSYFTNKGRVISRKGSTVLNSLQKMSNELKKEIYLGHLQVVIISKEIAKTDIDRIVDSFSRNPHIQRKLYLIISQGKAKEIISAANPLDVAPIPDISNMFDINKTNNFIPISLDEFIFRYRGVGFDAILPLVYVNDSILEVNGTAIFHKSKFVGELNGEETRALSLLIVPDFTAETYTVPGESFERNRKDLVSVNTKRKSSKIKVFLKEDQIEALLKIKLVVRISEYPIVQQDKEDDKLYEHIAQKLEDRLRNNLQGVIDKSLEYNSDIMGIGKYVRAKYMSYWDTIDWKKEYRNTKFTIDIDVQIMSSSSTQITID